MHMPKLTGLETWQQARQIRGRLPCILMSANADQALVEQALAAQIFEVLSKPVSRLRIMATVRLALQSAQSWTQAARIRPDDQATA